MVAGAANPLTQQQIQNYQNPYTQSVIDATQAQFNNQNAQAAAKVTGNSISNGALGGNRNAVGQAVLSGQQQLAQAPVIAGLYNQGYNQALQTAQQQYQANPQQAAGMLANFGLSGQNAALQGANAQIGAGTLQQQTQQAQNNANYGQFQNQQAYPFQVAQWLAQIGTGVGSQLGSTTTGQTTGPPPNPWNQILGLGTAGLGLAGKFFHDGGAVHKDGGGGVGGMPYGAQELLFAGVHGYIPEALKSRMSPQALHTSAAPHLIDPYAGSTDVTKMVDQAIQVADKINNRATMGSPGLASPIYKVGAAGDYAVPSFVSTGGGVHGYSGGGVPSFDDRFSAIRSPGIASTDPIIEPQKEEEPYRLAGPEAMAAWRNETPLPEAPVVAKGNDDDEDAKIPPASTPTAGVGSPLRRSANAPVAGLADAPEPVRPFDQGSQTAGFAAPPEPVDEGSYGSSKLSKHLPNALLTAGLGMLASRSPFLGVGIGEGGLAGMNAFSAAQAAEAKQNQENKRIEMEAQRLAQSATQAKIEQASKPLIVGKDGNMIVNPAWVEQKTKEAEIENEKAPSGYKRNDDGSLSYEKGGPHDPDVISKQTDARTKKGSEVDEDTIDILAHRVAQGDTRALIGLGRNPAAITQVNKRVAEIFKEQGVSHEQGAKEILSNISDQAGRMASERVLAGISSKLAVYGRNVDNAIGIVENLSKDVNRTNFIPVNKLINAYKTNTGDPKTVAMGQSLNTLTNEYARAIGGGHGTVHDKEEALKYLNSAQSHEQLVAIMNVMRQEVAATKKSMPEAREEQHDLYAAPKKRGEQNVTHQEPLASKPIQAAQASQSVSVTSPAQAKALAPGTRYRTPDGREFIR